MRVNAALLLSWISAVVCSSPSPQYDVSFASATAFDGKNYADGMPSGNGRVVVLGWGNQTAGGLNFFVRSPLAMHTDSTLFTLALVSVVLSPNPFAGLGYYNQTHHLSDGSITVLGGGTSLADYAAAVSLYVDANADVVMVSAA